MMKFLFIILEEFFAFKELEDHNITNFENLDYTNTIDNTSCLPDPVKKNVICGYNFFFYMYYGFSM
jgi:hypothetical protein